MRRLSGSSKSCSLEWGGRGRVMEWEYTWGGGAALTHSHWRVSNWRKTLSDGSQSLLSSVAVLLCGVQSHNLTRMEKHWHQETSTEPAAAAASCFIIIELIVAGAAPNNELRWLKQQLKSCWLREGTLFRCAASPLERISHWATRLSNCYQRAIYGRGSALIIGVAATVHLLFKKTKQIKGF